MSALLLSASPSPAQGRPQLKRPEESPSEKPPEVKKKKIKGPRAVGIVQLNRNGKGSLIPVAILIDGHFYDASAYKADPVPMALAAGTVYEAEQAGDSQGLFTVNGALHSQGTGSAHPWVGTGTFLPQGAVAPKSTRKAEDVPVGIGSGGDEPPPRLTKSAPSKPPGSDSAAASAPPAAGSGEKPKQNSAGASPADKSAANSADKTDPAKPASDQPPSESPASQPAGASTSSGQTSPNQAPSNQSSSKGSSSKESSQDSSSGNYYRPTLRRGKPTQDAAQNDAPQNDDSNQATAKAGANGVGSTAVPAAGAASKAPEPLRLIPAVSDAGGPEPQSYKFFWKTGEEEERRNQMLTLAANEIRAYANALARNHISAAPATPKAAASRQATLKQAKPEFDDVQFRGFDLWLTGQPVLILTAEARIPGWSEPGANAQPYQVTLVAHPDIYGDLHKLYAAVTDRFHLDVTPQLELIDVVDADGDGRGELLFHETSDAGSGYILYRATADKLWKMFDSLNAD